MCFDPPDVIDRINISFFACFRPLQNTRAAALFAPDRLFKVVLVGNSSVGKTSLLRSFCEGRFHPSTTATVGEKRNIAVTLRGPCREGVGGGLWMLAQKNEASHGRACEVTLPV